MDITYRSPDGKQQRERRTTTASKSVAQRWGEQRERELMLRGSAIKRKEVPTLKEFAPRFLDGYARANRHKPSGVAGKETILRIHLVPQSARRSWTPSPTAQVRDGVRMLRHTFCSHLAMKGRRRARFRISPGTRI